jgi:hypothetical protein
LDGSYKRKPDHVCARGVVRHVLNENFGLVYGPINSDQKTYCLFDTFDLVNELALLTFLSFSLLEGIHIHFIEVVEGSRLHTFEVLM